MSGVVEKLTGSRPDTCPWRAFYDPLVREVLGVARNAEKIGSAAVPEGVPAILFDALEVYFGALASVRAFDAEERRKQEDAKRNRPKR